jgi:acetyltransferase-like isoleucine patch superfamily enzyme
MSKVKKLLNTFSKDPSGTFFYMCRNSYIAFCMKIYSALTYFIAFLKNINLEGKCRFFGRTIFNRFPESKIEIGRHCTFRSDSTNVIGKNKKCILVTTQKNAIIKIGDRSGFNGSVIHCAEKVEIGNDVMIGYNTLIDDSDHHPIDPETRHTGIAENKPVYIKDNVWLGSNVVVLKGVTIGKNSVVGSNSVVFNDIPENSIAIGNPCRVIKKI